MNAVSSWVKPERCHFCGGNNTSIRISMDNDGPEFSYHLGSGVLMRGTLWQGCRCHDCLSDSFFGPGLKAEPREEPKVEPVRLNVVIALRQMANMGLLGWRNR